jgi:Flp pilus assembly protein TadD
MCCVPLERAYNTSRTHQPIIISEVVFAVALAAFALSAVELYEQGTALFQSGKLAEAAQRFEEASRLAPKDARIWKALGVSYAATADYERASGRCTRRATSTHRLTMLATTTRATYTP